MRVLERAGGWKAALGAAVAVLLLALASCGGAPGSSQGPASSPTTNSSPSMNSSPSTAPSSSQSGWG